MFVNGTKIGDCGNDFVITANMVGNDGSSYNFTVDPEAFFSVDGQKLTQGIARESHSYTFSLSVEATGAETIAEHQAQTESTGFV